MDTTTIPFYKNKLFWTGMIGAILVASQQLFLEPVIDWKQIGFAAFIAVGGYVATTLRGQNISMYSMIANVIIVIVTDAQDMAFDWKQLLIQAGMQVLAWIASDAKPVGYERAPAILNAKIQGQITTPNALVDNKVKAAAAQIVASTDSVEQAVSVAQHKTTV